MSADDVAVAQAGFTALGQGVEAALAYIHPDFEMTTLPGIAAEPDTYRGHDGVRRWFDEFLEVMDEVRLVPVALHDVAAGEVLVEFDLYARGQASGIEAEQRGVALVTVADGKLRRFEFFFSVEQACEELGLSPPQPG